MMAEGKLQRPGTVAVIGLGYVGLTTALLAARAGYRVLGVDINAQRLEMIAAGGTPFAATDPELHALCKKMIDAGALRVENTLCPSDIVFVAVPTPVLESGLPDEQALRAALATVAEHSPQFRLLLLESTLAPGTMQRLVSPSFDRSFERVVHAPERVMPGKLLSNATTLAKVVGVESTEAWLLAQDVFERVHAAPLRRTTWTNAELCKTAENAWRDVNIAFANTLALACAATGGEFETVRALVNESPGRQVLQAGVGVGGSCLPKDTFLLGSALPEDSYLRAARAVNEAMPNHCVELLKRTLGAPLQGKRILVLGASYLENISDLSCSPALVFARELTSNGATVLHHDAHSEAYYGDVLEMAAGVDAIALATDHAAYLSLDMVQLRQVAPAAQFFDLRGSQLAEMAQRANFRTHRLGHRDSSPGAEAKPT